MFYGGGGGVGYRGEQNEIKLLAFVGDSHILGISYVLSNSVFEKTTSQNHINIPT